MTEDTGPKDGLPGDPNPQEVESSTPIHERARAIAFIVDDEVADIIYTDDRLSAIFLSAPVMVELTSLMADPLLHPATGWGYDSETNSFIGRDAEDNVVSLTPTE